MIMKKILNIGLSALFVTGAMMLSGCSDKFLEEKKNFGNYVASDIYNNYETAQLRVGPGGEEKLRQLCGFRHLQQL